MSYPNLPAQGERASSKLPIPRLHKHRSDPPRKTVVNRQNRVSRACLSCRSRKIKCDGSQPRCSNCSENSVPCVYASSRKDRLKTATSHNQDLIALLRDLRPQVSTERQARIDDLLASAIQDVADAVATVGDPTDKYRGPIGDEDRGEADVSAEVGSSGEQEILDEDPMRNEETRATGFIGKASERQWLQRSHGADPLNTYGGSSWAPPGDYEAAAGGHLDAHRRGHSGHAILPFVPASKVSFYLDNEMVKTDVAVNPLEMPPLETAERLIQAYMQSVQNSFPFLEEKTFVSRFYHYYASIQRGAPYSVPRKWQATLNMVFAIGAVYSRLTKAEWEVDENDHFIYHSRAWSLNLQDPWEFSYPDLPHMQLTGLLSFFYLSIGHINRSWILIGNALRSGFAMGMHLRNEDDTASATRKEINSRIWWAHYSFEHLVSTLTGRPSLGMSYPCSVPLPLPFPSDGIEESLMESKFGDKGKRPLIPRGLVEILQPTDSLAQRDGNYYASGAGPALSGSYLRSILSLGGITQAALELYSSSNAREPWESVQRSISCQNDELDAWATALPEGLNFFHRSSLAPSREQNTLNILYQSTKLLITRPCLCRSDGRITAQATVSDTFNRRAALICVEAAQSIASLLPVATPGNVLKLYEAGPWWQMVHVMMQAMVVLCLEIVLQAKYISEDHRGLVPSLKKLLQWLRMMRAKNNMAVRAYAISVGLLKRLMSTTRIDLGDLLREDEVTRGHNEPSPAASDPSRKYTPYPNVLNPVDEPHDSRAPSVVSTTKQDLHQQQQQQQEQQRNLAFDVSQSTSYQSESSRSHTPQLKHSGLGVSADCESEIPVNVYTDLFLASTGLEQTVFPGWIVTSFDEPNLWAGLGVEGVNFEVQ